MVMGVSLARGDDGSTHRWTVLERLEPAHLQAASTDRARIAASRQAVPQHGLYQDYRAAVRVEVPPGPGAKQRRNEVLAAAKKTGVQVVMWSDPGAPFRDSWRGLRDGVLFIQGAADDEAGFFQLPEFDAKGQLTTNAGLRFLSGQGTAMEARADGFAGLEIVNRRREARLEAASFLEFLNAQTDPVRWAGITNAFLRFPDEWFAACVNSRPELMARWDRELARRRFVAIGAGQASQTQVQQGLVFDPYDVSFRHLSTHVFARELSEQAILQSLREGRAYVAHDWMCDPTGFVFGGVNNLGVFTMGDGVPWLGKTRIVAMTPVPARLRLIHGGQVVQEVTGTRLEHNAKALGAYRVEAWLTIDGEERPWIYSNPVHVELPSPSMLVLPSNTLAPEVEVAKDITYRDGPAEDAAKHRLDVYVPRGKKGFPVILFAHGGAWKSGDRSQYPPIGNRFAKEGIGFVVPSYRLAPKHPHPAQIEDVAAALAWTVEHIAEHGGDPKRIYLAGHSAGGHLVALLALDPRWLAAHQLTSKSIRGVMALSGVYDLSVTDAAESVFSADPAKRREASPQTFARPPAPPFLVSYCQWDYMLLPAQAIGFHGALRKAGIDAELVYVPGENHLSEMINVSKTKDPTARAMLRFVK